MDDVSLICRYALAAAFLLSAIWKLRNRDAFRLSFRSMTSSRFRRAEAPVSRLLPLTEAAVAVAIVIPWAGRVPSVAVALLMLAGFSLAYRHSATAEGCGCWAASGLDDRDERTAVLARNLILAVLAVGAVANAGGDFVAHAFAAAFGVAVAAVVLELPQIVAVARFHKTVATATEGGSAR